ncbi:unnamed protein product [Urochloa decumbens]|uniref:DUF7595 domain-containing protein n=1 Tax=Urochloa decumbens TaxID=240449 RepID=A0ABC8W1X0_9POAL
MRSSLPLDVMADIAARSDPVTLVRCAATCIDLRRRAADPAFHRHLRLRHADHFVPSLLRGHLVGKSDGLLAGDEDEEDGSNSDADKVWLVETTHTGANAATATVCRASERCHCAPGGGRLRLHRPVAWRDGLLLIRTARDLRVCNPATGRSQILPPEPNFQGQYVLLVGDGEGGGAVGRPFHVAKVDVVLSEGHSRYLKIQTFSSEHGGAWGSCTRIRAPQLRGSYLLHKGLGTPLVVGNSAYLLCLADAARYVLELNVRAARVTAVTTLLPETYPASARSARDQYLLATATARGSPIVLVADDDKISVWALSEHESRWEKQSQVVIHKDEIVRFSKGAVCAPYDTAPIRLEWFAERSGAVLIRIHGYGFFWLDLRSMAIVRHFSSYEYFVYCPYEMHLSSWAPTFGSSL